MSQSTFASQTHPPLAARAVPEVILALDFSGEREALACVEGIPEAEFVKVGLQLFTEAGPAVVRTLRAAGRRVFLDLKLHDIPNTVARAVESAAGLDVELLTVHAVGGEAMLRAAREAAGAGEGPCLLAVTVLTSLDGSALGRAWGREGVDPEAEVVRLATLARDAGMDGVVASVRELRGIRAALGRDFLVLTPGIRSAGEAVGDQARVATPQEAVRAGADYLVVGRPVTGARDPRAAFRGILEMIR